MRETLFIGIDPGKNGAIGIIDETGWFGRVEDMPANPRDLWECLSRPREGLGEVRVAIERQQSMPGQGVSSVFQTGYGFGCIVGVLAATGLPYEVISAGVWKKAMGLNADKEKSREKARALWPSAPLSLKKHEGRCEALLLAEWLRRRELAS